MPQSVKLPKVLTCSALIVLLTVPLGTVIRVDAGSTRVFLDPPNQTVGAIGDFFTINISIADVSNLYGYMLKLYFNSTVMNVTQAPIEGPFTRSSGQTHVFIPLIFTNHYNSTHGEVLVACTMYPPSVSGINGSGVLATIEFKSLVLGDSVPLHLTDVELSDPNSSPIPCEVSDGIVTVVPEFTSTVVVLTLIIASLFGILFRKRAMRKVSNFDS
jgi:hypothetical protein